MPIYVKKSGVWTIHGKAYVKKGGVWTSILKAYVKKTVSGVSRWVKFFDSASTAPYMQSGYLPEIRLHEYSGTSTSGSVARTIPKVSGQSYGVIQMGPGAYSSTLDEYSTIEDGDSASTDYLWGFDNASRWLNTLNVTQTLRTFKWNTTNSTNTFSDVGLQEATGDKIANTSAAIGQYDANYIWYQVSKKKSNGVTGTALSYPVYIMKQTPVYSSSSFTAGSSPTLAQNITAKFIFSNLWYRSIDESKSYIEWYAETTSNTGLASYNSNTLITNSKAFLTTATTNVSGNNKEYSLTFQPLSTTTRGDGESVVGKYIHARVVMVNSNTEYFYGANKGIAVSLSTLSVVSSAPVVDTNPTLTKLNPSQTATNAITIGYAIRGNTGTWTPDPTSVDWNIQYSTDQVSWTTPYDFDGSQIEVIGTDTAENKNHDYYIPDKFYTSSGGFNGGSVTSVGKYIRFRSTGYVGGATPGTTIASTIIGPIYALPTAPSGISITYSSRRYTNPPLNTILDNTYVNATASWTTATVGYEYTLQYYYNGSWVDAYGPTTSYTSGSLVSVIVPLGSYNYRVKNRSQDNVVEYSNINGTTIKVTPAPEAFSINSVIKGYPYNSYRDVYVSWGISNYADSYQLQVEGSNNNSTWVTVSSYGSNGTTTSTDNSNYHFRNLSIGSITPDTQSITNITNSFGYSNYIEVTTALPHGLTSGRSFAISGAERTRTVTNRSANGTYATITTSAAHGFDAGQTVVISGVASTFNGTYTIYDVPSSTTFRYLLPVTQSSIASSGTAAVTAYNGTFTVDLVTSSTKFTYYHTQPAFTSTFTATTGTVWKKEATITTFYPHGYSANNSVTISGTGVSNFNGSFNINSITDSTTFRVTFNNAYNNSVLAAGTATSLGVLLAPSYTYYRATVRASNANPTYTYTSTVNATGTAPQPPTISSVTENAGTFDVVWGYPSNSGSNTNDGVDWQVLQAKQITNATSDGTYITYTTASAHGFSAGQYATVAGASPSIYNVSNSYIYATTTNTFRVYQPTVSSYSSGGFADNGTSGLGSYSAKTYINFNTGSLVAGAYYVYLRSYNTDGLVSQPARSSTYYTIAAAVGSFEYYAYDASSAPSKPSAPTITRGGTTSNDLGIEWASTKPSDVQHYIVWLWGAAYNSTYTATSPANSSPVSTLNEYKFVSGAINYVTDGTGSYDYPGYINSAASNSTFGVKVSALGNNRTAGATWTAASNANSYRVNYTLSGATTGNGTFTDTVSGPNPSTTWTKATPNGGTITVNNVTGYASTDGSGTNSKTATLKTGQSNNITPNYQSTFSDPTETTFTYYDPKPQAFTINNVVGNDSTSKTVTMKTGSPTFTESTKRIDFGYDFGTNCARVKTAAWGAPFDAVSTQTNPFSTTIKTSSPDFYYYSNAGTAYIGLAGTGTDAGVAANVTVSWGASTNAKNYVVSYKLNDGVTVGSGNLGNVTSWKYETTSKFTLVGVTAYDTTDTTGNSKAGTLPTTITQTPTETYSAYSVSSLAVTVPFVTPTYTGTMPAWSTSGTKPNFARTASTIRWGWDNGTFTWDGSTSTSRGWDWQIRSTLGVTTNTVVSGLTHSSSTPYATLNTYTANFGTAEPYSDTNDTVLVGGNAFRYVLTSNTNVTYTSLSRWCRIRPYMYGSDGNKYIGAFSAAI